MGAEYVVYTEVMHEGRWVGVDPLVLRLKNNVGQKEDAYKMVPTYWNGSRTYFSKTYSKLRDLSSWRVRYDDLSEEVKKNLQEDIFDEGTNEENIKYLNENMQVVAFDAMCRAIPKEKNDNFGFVLKSDIYSFENENEEIYEWLSAEEYHELSDEEKRAYRYYEWNDPEGWVCHFIELKDRVEHRLKDFADNNYLSDYPDSVRMIVFVFY